MSNAGTVTGVGRFPSGVATAGPTAGASAILEIEAFPARGFNLPHPHLPKNTNPAAAADLQPLLQDHLGYLGHVLMAGLHDPGGPILLYAMALLPLG